MAVTSTFSKVVPGSVKHAAEDVSFVLSATAEDAAGMVQEKVGEVVRKITQDGKLQEKIGAFSRKVSGSQEVKEALGILNKVGLARQAMLADLNVLENGAMRIAQSSFGIDVGTQDIGLTFLPGAVTIKVSAASCLNLTKAIKELFELIAFLKILFDDINTALGNILDLGPLSALGDLSVGCLNVTAGFSASLDAIEAGIFANLPDIAVPNINEIGD